MPPRGTLGPPRRHRAAEQLIENRRGQAAPGKEGQPYTKPGRERAQLEAALYQRLCETAMDPPIGEGFTELLH